MTDLLNKFSNLKKFSETLKHEIRMFYVFDDYMGKNYIYFTTDDQCFAFGFNFYGCLGFGHNISIEEPQYVPELSHKNIIDFYKGFNFMFGRTQDSHIYCWGKNESGQLGLGFNSLESDFLKPQTNQYLSEKKLIDIKCGYKHVIALTSNGKVYGWGSNNQGQVGCGSDETIINYPINLTSISSDLTVKLIACGDFHSIALTIDGFLLGWGDNKFGQLATGDYQSSKSPKLIENKEINISKIVSSKSSTYFLSKEGQIYYSGENYLSGVEGKASKLIELPTKSTDKFIDISSGSPNYYCLAKTDQSIFEIMKNELIFFETNHKTYEQYFIHKYHTTYQTMRLINNSNDSDEQQIQNSLIDHLHIFPRHLKNIIQLLNVFDDTDGKNCIYLRKDKKVFAFGTNSYGILGFGDIGAAEEPFPIKELNGLELNNFYNGKGFMFGQCLDLSIYCWGDNSLGQLGLGYQTKYSKPVKNDFLSSLEIIDISCGQNHCLALTRTGDVYGWGDNEWGQVGCGSVAKIVTVPTRIEIFLKVKAISCGDDHCLILTQGKSVFSWGRNNYGQLGQFLYPKTNGPANIVDNNIISIACNHDNSYLLSKDGTLSVLGHNVCAFNANTSQIFAKLPPRSHSDATIFAKNNAKMVSLVDTSIFELRRYETPLTKQNHFSYNHLMVNNWSATHTPVHLNHYEVLSKLETRSGSFGNHFKCKNRKTNSIFLLNRLNDHDLSLEQSSETFNELEDLMKIKSEMLVNLQNIWIEENKIICIQMQYFDTNLLDLILAKPIAFRRKHSDVINLVEFYISLVIYRQIVDGINFLHSLLAPIAHRNLNLINILIDKYSNKHFIKISEFGLSKLTEYGRTVLSHENQTQIPFEYNYSTKEVIKSIKFGLKTDVFSLAVIGQQMFGITSLTSDNNKSLTDCKLREIKSLFKLMQNRENWWLRPVCSEILDEIDDILPDSAQIITNTDYLETSESLKNYEFKLFYEILKNALILKNK